jgi:hypothetical protein
MATVKQMKARMLPIHRAILESFCGGPETLSPNASAGEIRGYDKAMTTLAEWGAINADGLTNIGRELLTPSQKRIVGAT